MITIRILTQKSILVVLLVGNALTPLAALPVKPQLTQKRNQVFSSLFTKVKDTLISKGLEDQVAIERTKNFLQTKEEQIMKVKEFFKKMQLSFSDEKLIDTLAQYALYEKKFELQSYSSVVGLTQSVLSRPLSSDELQYIEQNYSTL